MIFNCEHTRCLKAVFKITFSSFNLILWKSTEIGVCKEDRVEKALFPGLVQSITNMILLDL